MVYSEVPNFSEPNPELLAQANQQNKSVSSNTPMSNFSSPNTLWNLDQDVHKTRKPST